VNRSIRTSTICRPEELANVPSLPGSLDEALTALEKDHEFLLKGDVFTKSMIDRWITYKREKEITPLRLRTASS
jgi:glutamine synthetase